MTIDYYTSILREYSPPTAAVLLADECRRRDREVARLRGHVVGLLAVMDDILRERNSQGKVAR